MLSELEVTLAQDGVSYHFSGHRVNPDRIKLSVKTTDLLARTKNDVLTRVSLTATKSNLAKAKLREFQGQAACCQESVSSFRG